MSLDFQPPDIDAPVITSMNQFNDVWKEYFRSLKNFLDAYITSSGFLPPELTTAQRNSISNPQNRTIIYNTDTSELQAYVAGAWKVIQVV